MITERQLEVVLSVVYEYIKSGETVGSSTVAKKFLHHRSPATIRNEMSNLEDLGFLKHTHTSSGRVPTSLGYRLYIDTVLERAKDNNSIELLQDITRRKEDIERSMHQASEMLSKMSNYIGIAAFTPLDTIKFHKVDLVLVAEGCALLVVVLEGGVLHKKMVAFTPDVSQDDLDEICRYINKFSGKTWSEVKRVVRASIWNDVAKYREKCVKAVEEIDSLLGIGKPRVFTGSFSHIMGLKDFQDLTKVKALCSFLEEEENMAHLVSACGTNGFNVTLGAESNFETLGQTAMVTAGADVMGQRAVVGLIGPERMDFEQALDTIHCVLDMITNKTKG